MNHNELVIRSFSGSETSRWPLGLNFTGGVSVWNNKLHKIRAPANILAGTCIPPVSCWREGGRVLAGKDMTSQNSEYAREEAKRQARNIRQATSNKEEASSTTNYDTTNHAHNNQQAKGNINTHSSSPPFILDLGRSWHCSSLRPALGTRQVSIPLFLSVKRQILLSLFDGAAGAAGARSAS